MSTRFHSEVCPPLWLAVGDPLDWLTASTSVIASPVATPVTCTLEGEVPSPVLEKPGNALIGAAGSTPSQVVAPHTAFVEPPANVTTIVTLPLGGLASFQSSTLELGIVVLVAAATCDTPELLPLTVMPLTDASCDLNEIPIVSRPALALTGFSATVQVVDELTVVELPLSFVTAAGVAVGVFVGVGVGVYVGVGVAVFVGVLVSVGVGVFVNVPVGVAVGVFVGVAAGGE